MAAVRARTMQASTRSNVRGEGRPSAATRSAPSAKGRAKMVWEKRIRRRNRVTAFGSVGLWRPSIIPLGMRGQQLFQSPPGARKNGRPMGKQHPFEGVVQELG